MNTAAYVDLLENNLIAFVDRMSLKEFILQQDNDPKHTSKLEKVNLIKKTRLAAMAPTITRFKLHRNFVGLNQGELANLI